MKTLKRHQLERLQKIGFQFHQESKICEPEKHGEFLSKMFKVRQLIFKHRL